MFSNTHDGYSMSHTKRRGLLPYSNTQYSTLAPPGQTLVPIFWINGRINTQSNVCVERRRRNPFSLCVPAWLEETNTLDNTLFFFNDGFLDNVWEKAQAPSAAPIDRFRRDLLNAAIFVVCTPPGLG